MAQALATPLAPSLSLLCNTTTRNPKSLSYSVSFPISTSPKFHGMTIKCARVGGVEILNNKRVEYSLQYIHGIGRTNARQILCDLGMENKITKYLSEEELITLRDEVSKYMIEGDAAGGSDVVLVDGGDVGVGDAPGEGDDIVSPALLLFLCLDL